jgi:hypothetical protein
MKEKNMGTPMRNAIVPCSDLPICPLEALFSRELEAGVTARPAPGSRLNFSSDDTSVETVHFIAYALGSARITFSSSVDFAPAIDSPPGPCHPE